jgi:hypothetical protein
MSKFRIKLKLQGLELEVEGSREDAPAMAEQIGRQFIGLVQPAATLASGDSNPTTDERSNGGPVSAGSAPSLVAPKRSRKKRNGQRPVTASGSAEPGDDEAAVDWTHDATHWGAPKQAWSTAQKALWLLYVAGQNAETKELSSGQLVATYTKHFRSAGRILKHNVTRDLQKIASGRGAKVSLDSGSQPPVWFLTDSGVEYAKSLIAEATGGPDAPPATDGAGIDGE